MPRMNDPISLAIALSRDDRPIGSLDEWWQRHEDVSKNASRPIDRAILGGAIADRVGYAFASGYQAALGALVPDAAAKTALLATEEGGAHPRAITTSLRSASGPELTLDGKKQWCTMASFADVLLVVARVGEDETGRPRLRLARIHRVRAGVTMEPLPETPFAPEIPHAVVTLDSVRVRPEEVLEGDGYDRYLKPFRTVEDLHVHAALFGYLLALAVRSGSSPELVEALLTAIAAARGLADLDPSLSSTHLALAGLLTMSREVVSRAGRVIDAIGGDTAARWSRDLPLLGVAGRAREKRREVARERLLRS
jgi:acyl-CoA dehydrogenase